MTISLTLTIFMGIRLYIMLSPDPIWKLLKFYSSLELMQMMLINNRRALCTWLPKTATLKCWSFCWNIRWHYQFNCRFDLPPNLPNWLKSFSGWFINIGRRRYDATSDCCLGRRWKTCELFEALLLCPRTRRSRIFWTKIYRSYENGHSSLW